jgi:hypothetical protein
MRGGASDRPHPIDRTSAERSAAKRSESRHGRTLTAARRRSLSGDLGPERRCGMAACKAPSPGQTGELGSIIYLMRTTFRAWSRVSAGSVRNRSVWVAHDNRPDLARMAGTFLDAEPVRFRSSLARSPVRAASVAVVSPGVLAAPAGPAPGGGSAGGLPRVTLAPLGSGSGEGGLSPLPVSGGAVELEAVRLRSVADLARRAMRPVLQPPALCKPRRMAPRRRGRLARCQSGRGRRFRLRTRLMSAPPAVSTMRARARARGSDVDRVRAPCPA